MSLNFTTVDRYSHLPKVVQEQVQEDNHQVIKS